MSAWQQCKHLFTGRETANFDIEIKSPQFAKLIGSDRISLTVSEVRAIMDGVINEIVRAIEDQLRFVPSCGLILLAGGFSQSPYLEERVKAHFDGKYPEENHTEPFHVVRLPRCADAVCLGATMIGLNPNAIGSRKLRFSYGVAIARQVRLHDPPSKVWIAQDGRRFRSNVFDVFASKGDDVKLDHCVTKRYVPSKANAELLIPLYASRNADPDTVDDEGVEKLMTIEARTKEDTTFGAEGIDIHMYFGRAIVEVVVQDVSTKQCKSQVVAVNEAFMDLAPRARSSAVLIPFK